MLRWITAVLVLLLAFAGTGSTLASSGADAQIDLDIGTPVILSMNGTDVRATLNNTVTAKALLDLLPYTVTVSREADDLCGAVSEPLPSGTAEGQSAWKIGEIGWFGGWFTILCDHEEHFSQMPGVMVIGKVDEEDMDFVSSLSGEVEITVRLSDKENEMNKAKADRIQLQAGDQVLTAILEENSSAMALKDMLEKGSMTIQMRDYGSMEKVGSLGASLPTNDQQITTEAGDLILYQGSAFVIYYAPNSWNFTKLGKIQGVTGEALKKVLGSGNVTVTLSLIPD